MENPPSEVLDDRPGDGEPRRRPGLFFPLLLLLTGLGFLVFLNEIEQSARQIQKWESGILFPDARPEETVGPSAIPAAVTRLPMPYSPLAAEILSQVLASPDGEELVESLQLDKGEYVALLAVEPVLIAALLEEGRPPVPGRLEAVAGDLATRDFFTLGDKTFTVVGRLQRGVGGLAYTYIIPQDSQFYPLFAPETGATRGWYDPQGRARLEEARETSAAAGASGEEPPQTGMLVTRTAPRIAAATLLALFMMAAGGSVLQYRLLSRLGQAPRNWGHIFGAMASRPQLFAFVNVALYGVFFAAMAAAYLMPLASMRFMMFIGREFSQGELSYIGQAYRSGDIFMAAAATFVHNFFQATVLLTMLPSLILPFAGFIKNLLTFGAVGFVMAPQWTGSVTTLVYHSVTMVLELEAYIVASFAVVLLPIRFFSGLRRNEPVEGLREGFKVVVGATILAGLLLAFAALYEAATIILFR